MASKDYLLKTQLPFSHGIEIENHLVDLKGDVLQGMDRDGIAKQAETGPLENALPRRGGHMKRFLEILDFDGGRGHYSKSRIFLRFRRNTA